jgi:hypothetical protein
MLNKLNKPLQIVDLQGFMCCVGDPDRKSYTYKYLYNLFIFFIIYIKHIVICYIVAALSH